MQKKSKLITISLCVFFTLTLILIILFPKESASGAKKGIEISINTLLPTLFPFMFLSIFLSTTGLSEKIFYYPSLVLSKILKKDALYFSLFFICILGGYLSAAKCISQYYKKGIITRKSAETLVCCYTNAGPSFLISAIGIGMFFSISFGIVLYISSVCASITMFLIYNKKIEALKHNTISTRTYYSECFVGSVKSTCSTIAIICSCVILFSVLLAFYPQKIGGTMIGILEVTSGVIIISKSLSLKSVLTTAFITGFSGLCIITQIISIFSEAGLSSKKFVLTRFIYAPLMTIYALVLINVVPITSSETFTNNSRAVLSQKSISVMSSLLLFCCCVLLPIYLSRVKK